MSKAIGASVLAEAQATDQELWFLAEIASWGGGTVRWSSNGVDVEYPAGSGTIYDGRPFDPGEIIYSSDGIPVQTTLTVADADLYVTKLHIANSVQGKTVTIKRLYLDPDDDSEVGHDTLADGLVVGALSWDDTTMGMELHALRRAMSRPIPGRVIGRICWREYQDPDEYTGAGDPYTCQYADTCDRSWANCESNSYTANFGAYPLIRKRRWG